MTNQPQMIKFHDGHSIPQVGLGVWQTPNDIAAPTIRTALEAGYRHIDTAAIYGNEEGVGEGIRSSGIDRKDIFLTTKLWNEAQGFDSTLKAFDESLKRLGTDYVDLYLIHWPAPRREQYLDTWKAFLRLREEGRIRSIGVSNFNFDHLERIISDTGVTPVINQIELHPDFQQKELRDAYARYGIITESWSPLGRGKLLDHSTVQSVASKHNRTAAQVIIRWHIDKGFVVIPKSVTPSRIRENFEVFDFTLDSDDMAAFDKMDGKENRTGPDPETADF